MSRVLTIVFAIVATIGFSATNSWGQCGCSNGTNSVAQTPAQTYQRFSYEPSAIPSSQSTTRTTTNVPMMASQPQAYRRFSYTPSSQMRSNSSGSKQAWEYSKTDPRKYRP